MSLLIHAAGACVVAGSAPTRRVGRVAVPQRAPRIPQRRRSVAGRAAPDGVHDVAGVDDDAALVRGTGRIAEQTGRQVAAHLDRRPEVLVSERHRAGAHAQHHRCPAGHPLLDVRDDEPPAVAGTRELAAVGQRNAQVPGLAERQVSHTTTLPPILHCTGPRRHMPQTWTSTPPADMRRRWNTFSSQLRPSLRSNTTRWPASAAQRST